MIKQGTKIYKSATPKIALSGTKVYYGGGQFLPETEALFTRARAEGFSIPDIFIKRKIDTIIYNLKITGLWQKTDCFFWFAYGTASYSNFKRIDWKSPTGALATYVGGLTADTSGFKGNALNAYINTGFVPSVNGLNYTLNNASVFATVYQATVIGGLGSVIWGDDNSTVTVVNGQASGQKLNSTTNLPVGRSFFSTGFKMMARPDGNNVNFYNQSTQTTTTQTANALPNTAIKLLNSSSTYSDVGVSNFGVASYLNFNEYLLFRSIINNGLNSFSLNQIA